MTNHIRTLLLNRDGHQYFPGEPLEEYVPPEFRARRVPQDVQRARDLLFGKHPDRTYLNYRVRQAMDLIHGSELESLVLRADSRITYWPHRDAEPPLTLFRNAVPPGEDFVARLQAVADAVPSIPEWFAAAGEDAETLRNVWREHPWPFYRYAAMLLAMAYVLDGQEPL